MGWYGSIYLTWEIGKSQEIKEKEKEERENTNKYCTSRWNSQTDATTIYSIHGSLI